MRRTIDGLGLAVTLLALAGCGGSGSSGGGGAGDVDPDFVAPPAAVAVTGFTDHIMEPFLSRDGQLLFFNNRNDPPDLTDLHVAQRMDDVTFTYLGPLGGGANTAKLDAVPSMDAAGRFYLVSLRSYDTTLLSVFAGDFAASAVTSVTAVAGIARLVPGFVNFDAEIGASGDRLYYVDGFFSGGPVPDAADILVATRAGGATFVPVANAADILRTVNTPALEYAPALTADELEIFFTRLAPGGGDPQLFRATRASVGTAFGPARRIAPASGFVEAATVAPDGRSIYYHALEAGRFVLRRIAR